jgi:hypothetical protein
MLHKVVAQPGKEPRDWAVVTFADPGEGSEEVFNFFFSELPEIVDATLIFGQQRKELKDAFGTILIEGLLPAFEHLKRIRASVGVDIPMLNRNQHFEDFAGKLWHTYKDLWPQAIAPMGYNIGFVFQDDGKFEKEWKAFQTQHQNIPATLGDFLRKQRSDWQCELAAFRNDYLEHRKPEVAKFENLYEPKTAEFIFERGWKTIAEVSVLFLSRHLPASTRLEVVPPQEQNPTRPRHFRFAVAPGVRFVRPGDGSDARRSSQ